MVKATKNTQVELDNDDEMIDSIVSFSEDISEAEAPEPLPASTYPATITESVLGKTKTDKPMATVKFKINEEDYPADFDAGNAPGGKTLTHFLVLEDTPAGRHRVKQFCQAIGAPMSKRLNVAEWVGLTAELEINHEEYEGVMRERIRRVNPA